MKTLAERSRHRREPFVSPLSFTATLPLPTITCRWVLECASAFQAFILAQDQYNCDPSLPNAATMVYFRASDPRYLASSALYVITTLIGDSFIMMVLNFLTWLLCTAHWQLLINFMSIAYLLCGAETDGSLCYRRLSWSVSLVGSAS
jgi:hypothetical protein